MIALLLACVAAAPETPPPAAPEPAPLPVGRVVTLRVPSDCPHIIVDILSVKPSGQASAVSDVTVGCFGPYSARTYLGNYQDQPIGVNADPSLEDRLVIEFAQPGRLAETDKEVAGQ